MSSNKLFVTKTQSLFYDSKKQEFFVLEVREYWKIVDKTAFMLTKKVVNLPLDEIEFIKQN